MRHATSRLGFDSLESRDCPAGRVSVFLGVMLVTGDAGANAVTISDNGAGTVTATIDSTTRTASGVYAVSVVTGNGNDTIGYALANEQKGLRLVNVDAGGGDDAVTLTGTSVAGAFAFVAFGGAGTDTLSATLGGVKEGGIAGVALDGGSGTDTVTGTVSGEIDGVLGLGLSGGGGNDTVSGSVTAAAGSTGLLAVGVAGGADDDTLTLTVTGDGLATLAEPAAAGMDGGSGTDTGTRTANVSVADVENDTVLP